MSAASSGREAQNSSMIDDFIRALAPEQRTALIASLNKADPVDSARPGTKAKTTSEGSDRPSEIIRDQGRAESSQSVERVEKPLVAQPKIVFVEDEEDMLADDISEPELRTEGSQKSSKGKRRVRGHAWSLETPCWRCAEAKVDCVPQIKNPDAPSCKYCATRKEKCSMAPTEPRKRKRRAAGVVEEEPLRKRKAARTTTEDQEVGVQDEVEWPDVSERTEESEIVAAIRDFAAVHDERMSVFLKYQRRQTEALDRMVELLKDLADQDTIPRRKTSLGSPSLLRLSNIRNHPKPKGT